MLCEFRKRLIIHSAEARVFDIVLAQLKALGLLTPHGIPHTDSLCLLSRARDLGRLELVFETMRYTLRSLLKADAEWLRATIHYRYRALARVMRLPRVPGHLRGQAKFCPNCGAVFVRP